MKKLSKRSYPAYADLRGKWFTGWDGDTEGCIELPNHEYRQLRLQFVKTKKGRSSAIAVFRDAEDTEFNLSFNTLELILVLLHHKRVELHQKYDISETRDRNGTWVEGTFMQVKRGANYFIEPVEVF